MHLSNFCFILCLLPICFGHICLTSPRQRGQLDVSDPGDPSCFQPEAPCGTFPAQTPTTTFTGGSTLNVQFQQNLNHYMIGKPGIIEISWSNIANPTQDTDFYAITQVPDYNAHDQAAQTNFSVPIIVPNINCAHCVLRVRYMPNKPTEPTFHQCADVATVQANDNDNTLFGISFPDSPAQNSWLVSINSLSGGITYMASLNYDIRRGGKNGPFIQDQLCTVNQNQKLIYYYASNGPLSSVPNMILIVNSSTLEMDYLELPQPGENGITYITYDSTSNSLFALQIVNIIRQFYSFNVVQINLASGQINQIVQLPKDDTYVNFQWATFNEQTRMLYILIGNEDDPFGLSTYLYSVNVDTGNFSSVQPDNSKWTIAGIHSDPVSNQLFSVSPGLFTNTSYTLVTVDPVSGVVTPKFPIAPSGKYVMFYGGDIFGWNYESRILQYALHDSSGNGVIASINVDNGRTAFLQVDALPQIHNLAFVAN